MSPSDVMVTIEFRGKDSIPAGLVAQTLSLVDDAVYALELKDIDKLASITEDIPRVALDAARFRLRDYKGRAFLATTTSSNSIVIGGLVAGLAIYILQQTLGETIREAWIESSAHRAVKEFLVEGARDKANQISKAISSRLRRRRRVAESKEPEVKLLPSPTGFEIRIVIEVAPSEVPPPRGLLLDDEGMAKSGGDDEKVLA